MSVESSAFSEDEVTSLTGLTRRQLRYWDKSNFFSPEFEVDGKRVYSFRDLVALRAIAPIRDRLSLQAIRKISRELHKKHDAPWSTFKFYFAGGDLVYQSTTEYERLSTKHPGQEVMEIDLEEVRGGVVQAMSRRERGRNEIGRVTQMRDVMRNAPVLKGTRVTTEAIFDFHEAGYEPAQILEQYPGLTAEDVAAAIRWERRNRRVT